MLAAAAGKLRNCSVVEEAEALACLEGTNLSHRALQKPLNLESNCSTVVESLTSKFLDISLKKVLERSKLDVDHYRNSSNDALIAGRAGDGSKDGLQKLELVPIRE